jgi:hypothetical protein
MLGDSEARATARDELSPSVQTVRRLRQYGLTQGQIQDRLSEYRAAFPNGTDQAFLRYAARQSQHILSALTLLPQGWCPSPPTLTAMESAGIPATIRTEYLKQYSARYANQPINQSNWNDHCLACCLAWWAEDNRNERAINGSYMGADWTPGDDLLAQLESQGMDRYWLDTLALEFRLYWKDIGKKKANWRAQFAWWARKNWSPQP